MKNKILTFSFDDAVTQDARLIELFNKYGMKATFNINTCWLGQKRVLKLRSGATVNHNKFDAADIKHVYAGHELASHSLTHPDLTKLSEEDVIREVEQDRLLISELCGYEVVGFAYPGGDYDARTSTVIKEKTGVKYARTIDSNHFLDVQDNLFEFKPTCHHADWDFLFKMGEEFLSLDTDEKKIFYVWGHAYEFDGDNSWGRFEEFIKLMAHKDDIAYLTNKEALL